MTVCWTWKNDIQTVYITVILLNDNLSDFQELYE
jgi:hypothetical protein